VLAVQEKVFRCLQRVAVAKTFFLVILAYSFGKLLEAFSQLELVIGSLHALLSTEYLHLVGDPRPVLWGLGVCLALFLFPCLFPANDAV
jgi:hypothetical protein